VAGFIANAVRFRLDDPTDEHMTVDHPVKIRTQQCLRNDRTRLLKEGTRKPLMH
jgi:hypothetical protein